MANKMIKTAMILAAGLGERMKPLTETTPKPLLAVKDKPLIQYHIEALAKAGVENIVINHGRLGEMIEETIGNGERFNLAIQYSAEGDAPLETAGGIVKALPLINDDVFIVVNADIYTDFDFTCLKINSDKIAHLVLINNPEHNSKGDFGLDNDKVLNQAEMQFTFSGIASYEKSFFKNLPKGKFALAPILRDAIKHEKVSGQLYKGNWIDVGTPIRLQEANTSNW